MFRTPLLSAVAVAVGLLGLITTGCSSFDAPPQPTILDTTEGILSDPSVPVQVGFHEPIVPESLQIKIVRFETDAEGNLFDEDDDPETELEVFYQHPGPDGYEFPDLGGTSSLTQGGQLFTMNLATTLPIGPQLAVIIEPGLRDAEGNEWKVRKVLKFGYEFSCGGEDTLQPTTFPSGVHFMVADIDVPIQTQLQLIAVMEVNPDTGEVIGQFTNADRDESIDCAEYGLSCDSSEACRTLPTPECVPPSQGAGNADEYPDFTFNNTPPTGYGFTALACVRDEEDGSFTFANAPVDVEVQSPPVTVKAIRLNGSFAFDDSGILRGEGTLSAPEIFLGTTSSGAGAGTINVREIPPEEVPAGVPGPPEDPGAL